MMPKEKANVVPTAFGRRGGRQQRGWLTTTALCAGAALLLSCLGFYENVIETSILASINADHERQLVASGAVTPPAFVRVATTTDSTRSPTTSNSRNLNFSSTDLHSRNQVVGLTKNVAPTNNSTTLAPLSRPNSSSSIIVHRPVVTSPQQNIALANSTITRTNKRITIRRRRWYSRELKQWVQLKMNSATKNIFSSELQMTTVMDLAPKPQGEDVEIYNVDAWHRLRLLLGLEEQSSKTDEQVVTHSSSNKVILCSNGGSSTAGAGNVFKRDRYDEVFAAMIRARRNTNTTEEREISVVNQGHGNRGSMHSGLLMHSFIPADTDVIIWEFAINDFLQQDCEAINSVLLVWLEQVAKYSSPPPLVVLAYLWDIVMAPTEHGRINGKVFECHDRIAATYDFVVGSVNLASYFNRLDWDYNVTKKSFVADFHHPNEIGHFFLANLLWDLVFDDARSPITPFFNNETTAGGTIARALARPKPHWRCKRDSPMKKQVVFLAEEKNSFASWVSVFPRNDDGDNAGMLSPRRMEQSHTNFTYITHGKADESRQDREISTILPCCTTGEHLDFDLSSISETNMTRKRDGSTEDRRKLLSAFHMLVPDVNVAQLLQDLQIELLDSKGEIIELGAYTQSRPELFLVDHPWAIGGPWVLFPNETAVSRIGFCSRCSLLPTTKLSLEYLALF